MNFPRSPSTPPTQAKSAQQSIIKALNGFMQAMDQMSEVVMVPNRLKDIEVPSPSPSPSPSKALPSPSASSEPDLYSFYRMLHCVQQELVYGVEERTPKRSVSGAGSVSSQGSSGRSSGSQSPMESDMEQEGFLTPEIQNSQAHRLATNFKIHLQGLFDIMHELTEKAHQISDKYQEDVSSVRKD